MTLLRELNRANGVTLVVITHDASIAAAAGRQIELRDGQVVADTGVLRVVHVTEGGDRSR